MSYPKELAAERKWVCWRLEADPKGEKPRKVPYDPRSGKRASSTNPENWGTLEEALTAKEKFFFAGVGYVFTEDGGIVGVDIDHCIDGDGTLNECAKAITEKYPTYTEISPSGTGLHLFYRGSMPGKGNKNSTRGVEMYGRARYFTMTGKQMEGSPDEIRDGEEALKWIHETFIAKAKTKKTGKAKNALKSFEMSDEDLLEKARKAKNGEDFSSLFQGEWQGRFGSQSEADLSLCCALAFWSGKNAEQMDRLFRESGLYRPKWDTVHDADGATYGQKTIAAALERTEEVYEPGAGTGIIESEGRYLRVTRDGIYPITNFILEPNEMLEFEDEAQMTCEMVTTNGRHFRQTMMTSDMSSVPKFRNMLSKKTICLSYMGSENDLEMLKGYLSNMEWKVKKGVRASGLYEKDGVWRYVDQNGAFHADGTHADDILQMSRAVVIDSRMTEEKPAAAEDLKRIGPQLMAYNEPAKTVTVLAWSCGCFCKEMLRQAGIKYPHLYMIGEAGSGKSTTMERIIQPLFGVNRSVAAPQVTAFTLMKESASSNLYPQTLDEFKPSRIDRNRMAALSSHFRDSYDGHRGVRGKADQSQVSYELLAPLAVAGEEAPEEPSIRERGMELMFSKKDLKDAKAREAFQKLSQESRTLTGIGRLLLDTALEQKTETVAGWYRGALGLFDASLPSRVINNLACCMTGLRLMEAALGRIGAAWGSVFPIPPDACGKWLENGTRDYLLDGRTSNKTVVEQSLEIIDRMGLSDEECRFLDDHHVAIYFKGMYDRFTRYIRENAIITEFLQYGQFMKQLRKSDIYLETKVIRMGEGDTKRVAILNFDEIRNRCDVDGFLKAQVHPL